MLSNLQNMCLIALASYRR